MKVYKYNFQVSDKFTISMPKGAKILHIDLQHNQPTIWALGDQHRPIESHAFRVFCTGHDLPDNEALKFVATFLQSPFVWHVFEEEKMDMVAEDG